MHKHMAMTVVICCLVGANGWIAAQDFQGNADKGEAIYKAHCLRCHGRFGDGNGPDARDLIVQPKDFHTLQSRGRTDFELLVAISNGVLFSPMHSWRGRLTDEEMLNVISYIRALAPARATS
jgi:cytochrome c oxidase cbb3-type subunit 3